MDINAFYILALIAFGSMVQTLTGFAMGLIIMGGVTIFSLVNIESAAAMVSLISLVNASVALRKSYKFVDRTYVKWLALGMLPMIVVGVSILDYLSSESSLVLQKLLGFVIVFTGVLMMLKPTPFSRPSGKITRVLVGAGGGLMGGMYGAGGAPIAYLMYRQPLDLNIVRATLLGGFALSTVFRTIAISVAGQVTEEVLHLVVFAIPLVILVTLTTSRFAHHVPDALIRKFVFVLLVVLGLFLMMK